MTSVYAAGSYNATNFNWTVAPGLYQMSTSSTTNDLYGMTASAVAAAAATSSAYAATNFQHIVLIFPPVSFHRREKA